MDYRHEIITTSKKFPVVYIIHNNNNDPTSIVRHWHEALEISFTIKGCISKFYISGKMYQTKENDILIINSNQIHSVSVTKVNQNLALTLIFPFDFMKNEFPEINSIYFDLNEKENFTTEQKKVYERLQRVMQRFSAVVMEKVNTVDSIKLKVFTYEILYILIKYFSVEKKSLTINSNKYIERLSSITKYINKNYAQKLTVVDLGNEFHLSVSYLSRFFKNYMDLSIYDYVTQVRLNYAHDLLLDSSISMNCIAIQTGFPNDKAFTTAFKKIYKETPYQYRKSHKMTFF